MKLFCRNRNNNKIIINIIAYFVWEYSWQLRSILFMSKQQETKLIRFFFVYHHKSIACLEHLVLVLAQKNAFAGCEVLELNAYVLNK